MARFCPHPLNSSAVVVSAKSLTHISLSPPDKCTQFVDIYGSCFPVIFKSSTTTPVHSSARSWCCSPPLAVRSCLQIRPGACMPSSEQVLNPSPSVSRWVEGLHNQLTQNNCTRVLSWFSCHPWPHLATQHGRPYPSNHVALARPHLAVQRHVGLRQR